MQGWEWEWGGWEGSLQLKIKTLCNCVSSFHRIDKKDGQFFLQESAPICKVFKKSKTDLKECPACVFSILSICEISKFPETYVSEMFLDFLALFEVIWWAQS